MAFDRQAYMKAYNAKKKAGGAKPAGGDAHEVGANKGNLVHPGVAKTMSPGQQKLSGIDALKHPAAAMSAHVTATVRQLKPGEMASMPAKKGTYRIRAQKHTGEYFISFHPKKGQAHHIGNAKNPQEAASLVTTHHANKA